MQSTEEKILKNAIRVFGKYGLRKATVDELAHAAGLSKQCLYLHYNGKEDIYVAAVDHYLSFSLQQVRDALSGEEGICERIVLALERWFGRHKDTFSPEAADVLTLGNDLTGDIAEQSKNTFKSLLSESITLEFNNKISNQRAVQIAEIIFVCGLSWSEYGLSRSEFSDRLKSSVSVCLPRELWL